MAARGDAWEIIDAAEPFAYQSPRVSTVADLDPEPARGQLADPFIAPKGITILYGRGGTGKGVTAAHLIRRLVREGHRPYVLDYEMHTEEWVERLIALGMTEDERRQVAYRTPYGEWWPDGAPRGPLIAIADGAPRGPLIAIADTVRQDAADHGATVIVVDSYTPATSTGDSNGGADAAQEFATAAARIGLPILVLAHVPKSAERFPPYPFGSVFAHNLARMTWAVEALPSDDFDPANPYAPSVVKLELRNMKRNRGAKVASQFLTFSFFHRGDESLESIATSDEPGRRTNADMAWDVLTEPMSLKAIRAAIREDFGAEVAEETLRVTLQRSPRFTQDRSNGRPYPWSRA